MKQFLTGDQVHKALVKHSGEEVAVKLVDLEKLDAKLVWLHGPLPLPNAVGV